MNQEPQNLEHSQSNENEIPSDEAEDVKLKYKKAAKRSLLTNVAIFVTFSVISGIVQLLHDRSFAMILTMSSLKSIFPVATTLANFGNIQSLTKLYIEKMMEKISNFKQRFF